MQIQKLTLDKEDMKKAVQAYLATLGITIPVESVDREYSWKDFEVNFKLDPEPAPPRELPQAAEPMPEAVAVGVAV